MNCQCPDETYVQSTVEGVVICTKTTVIEDVFCAEGCQTLIREDGTAYCECEDSVPPTTIGIKNPIYFDNEEYFTDVSWTIAYKPTEGSWNSYFSFTPDYSPFHNNFFQVGYNWGQDKETLWNHTMSNKSFQVFQGRVHPFIVEYPIQNQGVNKMLNSIQLDIESKRYQNDWDYSQWKGIGFNKLVIYNNTNNSGMLNLFEQKSLSDIKKYPKTNSNNTQDILYTATDSKHNINYFFNRTANQDNNVPQWLTDKNNILKTINPKAVNFNQKKILERLKGQDFSVRLINDKESRFEILLKRAISDENISQ